MYTVLRQLGISFKDQFWDYWLLLSINMFPLMSQWNENCLLTFRRLFRRFFSRCALEIPRNFTITISPLKLPWSTFVFWPAALADMIYILIIGACAVCAGAIVKRRIKAESFPSDTLTVAWVLSWQAPRSSITFNCSSYCHRTHWEKATHRVYGWARPTHVSLKALQYTGAFPFGVILYFGWQGG